MCSLWLLLSPLLFTGPPGYRESAIDALGVSPTRRKRIREAARRGPTRNQEIRNFLSELSEKELTELAERMGETARRHEESTFVEELDPQKMGTEGIDADRALVDPTLTPRPGELVLLTDGTVTKFTDDHADTTLGVITELRRSLPRGE